MTTDITPSEGGEMSEHITFLRLQAQAWNALGSDGCRYSDVADELERLEAENAALRAQVAAVAVERDGYARLLLKVKHLESCKPVPIDLLVEIDKFVDDTNKTLGG